MGLIEICFVVGTVMLTIIAVSLSFAAFVLYKWYLMWLYGWEYDEEEPDPDEPEREPKPEAPIYSLRA